MSREAGESFFQAGRCLVIGEVAQAHDGSLGLAHAYIDVIAKAGADAVKFQTHIAEAESTPQEPWRIRFSSQDASRYDYWKRMEFSEPQWAELKKHADDVGLLFLSSPFSLEAFELLRRVGVSAWKIASGEVSTREMVIQMSETGLPMILSTGMSSLEEIDRAVAWINEFGNELAVLQCTSAYPCPPERVGLNMLGLFRDRYQTAVGLSDHSGTIYPGLAAATLGSEVIEVHVTMSREMFGPDVPASVTTFELKQLVDGVRFIEKMLAAEVNKDETAQGMAVMRDAFTKSIITRVALKAGSVIQAEHLTVKKPGIGMPAERIAEVVGKRLRRDVPENHFLVEDDVLGEG